MLIVIVALVAAFALLMVVRSGVIGGSDSGGASATKPLPATAAVTPAATQSDAATPAAQGEALQRRIPGARLSVLEGAGHLANLEQPDAFTRLLVDHLTARPATEVA